MTARQADILAAIVQTYAQTAEPVGSLALADAFDVSPATVRAEMVGLERLGLIAQPHTSAGRVPTDQGYRVYVNSLSGTTADPRVSQAIARRVKSAGQTEQTIKSAVDSLVDLTHNLSWATLPDNLYLRGIASLFSQPEMANHTQAYEVARLLDSLNEWIREASWHGDRVNVYIGRENPIGRASGCSLIIARFASPYSDESYIGMIGPTRQNYPRVLGLIDYTSKMLEEQLA